MAKVVPGDRVIHFYGKRWARGMVIAEQGTVAIVKFEQPRWGHSQFSCHKRDLQVVRPKRRERIY